MPTQVDLAKAWGVSPAYISQLVSKKGMPIKSFKSVKEATEWRERNAMRRKSPTSKPGPKTGIKTTAANLQSKRISKKIPPAPAGDGTLESALKATVRVAEQAEGLVLEAMRQGSIPDIPPLLSIHNKAVDQRFAAERAYREEMEKQGMLINRIAGTEMWAQGFMVFINKLKRLPQNKAQLANPQAPLVAFGVLEDAVNEIMEAAQAVYAKFNVQQNA